MNKINNKRIAKNTLMLYARQMIGLVVSLYTSRVVLEVLGVEDYGIYSVVGGVVSMFGFLNMSMSGAIQRFLTFALGTNNLKELKTVFSVSVVNQLLIAVVIIVLAETIGLWFLYNKLVIPPERFQTALYLYQFSIISATLSITKVPFTAAIIAYERMGIFALVSVGLMVLNLIIALLLTVSPYDNLLLYGFLLMLTNVFAYLSNILIVKYKFRDCSFKLVKDKAKYKQMFSYSAWDLLGCMSVIAQGQGLNMLLNIFFGPSVNAARGVAYQIQGAVSRFSGSFMVASRPQIIKLYAAKEYEQMHSLIYNSAKYSFCLLWLFILPLLLETEYVLTLWLKTVPEHTILFTKITLVVLLVDAWRSPFITGMHATGKIKIPNVVCGTLLILTLPISYLFLTLGYAADSVFIILLTINTITLFVEWSLIRKSVGFKMRDAIKKVIGTSIMIAIVSAILPIAFSYFTESNFINLVIVSSLAAITTSFSTYFIALSDDSRTKIKQKIKQKL